MIERSSSLVYVNVGFTTVMLAACWASSLVTLSSATWTFSVSIIAYDNPNGLDSTGQWCDPFHTACDPYFLFCLRPMDYDERSDQCPLGEYSTVDQYIDDTNQITFNVPGHITEDVPNPLVFTGTSWTGGGFQLLIRISDYDTIGSNDLIDRIIVNAALAPSGNSGPSDVQQLGSSGSASMTLRYSLTCDANYYGNTCDEYCIRHDDATGHYTCDPSGSKVCSPGYENETTSCITPVCSSNCSLIGGYCDLPNECRCKAGWSGETCSQCVTVSGCAHGHCNTPEQCLCDPGYSGPLCRDLDHDVCGHQSPCQHGGACANTGSGMYQCTCSPGWTGSQCEIMDNPDTCLSAPCTNDTNGGACLGKSPGCPCPAGFTGPDCTSAIDGCVGVVCQNRGECVDNVGSYLCRCPNGFTGEHCETDRGDCNPNPCHNGGTCVGGTAISGFYCSCSDGFGGAFCDVRELDICFHGGTYVNVGDGYICICPVGYKGTQCETSVVCASETSTTHSEVYHQTPWGGAWEDESSQPTVAEWKLASVSLHVGAALMAVIVATVILIAVGIVCLLRVKRQRDLRSYNIPMQGTLPIHNPLYGLGPTHGPVDSSAPGHDVHHSEQPPQYWNAVLSSAPLGLASTEDGVYCTIEDGVPLPQQHRKEAEGHDAGDEGSMKLSFQKA